MTVGAALVVIVVGLVIAAFLNATIGGIVVIIGIVGIVFAALAGRSRSTPPSRSP